MQDHFNELEKVLTSLASGQSLNDIPPLFKMTSKCVWEEGGWIYRAEDPALIKVRIAFYKEALKTLGFDFFEKEELIKETPWFAISRQKKILPFESKPHQQYALVALNDNFQNSRVDAGWEFEFCNRVYIDYGEERYKRIKDFCHRWKVIFMHRDNVGISQDGKVQCYDYAANIALNQRGELSER